MQANVAAKWGRKERGKTKQNKTKKKKKNERELIYWTVCTCNLTLAATFGSAFQVGRSSESRDTDKKKKKKSFYQVYSILTSIRFYDPMGLTTRRKKTHSVVVYFKTSRTRLPSCSVPLLHYIETSSGPLTISLSLAADWPLLLKSVKKMYR